MDDLIDIEIFLQIEHALENYLLIKLENQSEICIRDVTCIELK